MPVVVVNFAKEITRLNQNNAKVYGERKDFNAKFTEITKAQNTVKSLKCDIMKMSEEAVEKIFTIDKKYPNVCSKVVEK